MPESPLTAWVSFYVVIGTAAASLTGLMFVVITLLAGRRARRPDMGIAAFSSPTIVHFCIALAVAAILSAPWQVLWHASLLLGLSGLGGLAYSAVVVRRIGQAEYRPVLEDWSWHVALPLVSYVALVVGALFLPGNPAATLFLVGAATVLLLFIGIHNAWDNVTYIVVDLVQPPVEDPHEDDHANVPGGGHTHTSRASHPTSASPARSASRLASQRKKR